MTDENQDDLATDQDDLAVDSLFENEADDAETKTEETPESESEDKVDDAEASTGETEDKPEEGESKDTGPPPEPTLVPIAALHDERRKAQQYKAENETLKKQIPKSDEEPDVLDDPEAWKDFQRTKIEKEHIVAQQAEFTERFETSRSVMLEKHDDYLKIEKEFYFLASQDEALALEMTKATDPALFAYEKGNEHRNAQKETLRAEVLTEASNSTEKETPAAVKVPSLATATDQGSNSTPVEKDEDLEDMFDDQSY